MKTFLLSFKLFLKKPFSNAVMVIELAVVTLVVVVANNMYQYSMTGIRAFQNSGSRIIYCSNPSSTMTGAVTNSNGFDQTLREAKKNFSYIQGYSRFSQTTIIYDKQKIENALKNGASLTGDDGSDIYLLDSSTIRALPLPVSRGSWMGTEKIDGKIPCVVGGVYASHYQIGQVLLGYTLGKDDAIVPMPEFVVTGVLAPPQQIPEDGTSATRALKVSDLFRDMTNQEMFLLAPGDLAEPEKVATPDSGLGAFLYLNKSATDQQIQQVREYFNYGYTQMDTEMIREEEKQNTKDLSILLPFLILLFLIIFAGLISTCMLTTVKNMQTFKIYYLTGCPESKITRILFFYTLYYFIAAGSLFWALLIGLRKIAQPLRLMQADLILQNSSIVAILLICLVVLACTLSIPYLILKKNSLVQLLRKD